MQLLRLSHGKEGQRINGKGPILRAVNVTHAQAQELSNKGFASWFIFCDAATHPCESERPMVSAEATKVDEQPKPKTKPAGKESLVPPAEPKDSSQE